jgi:hypothetical protein
MPTKSSTTKYLLIAGVAAVGYYLHTRSSAQAQVAAAPVNPADAAFVQSWAKGLTGQGAINFQNAFPTLSASDLSNWAALIKKQEDSPGVYFTGPEQDFYDYFVSKTGF